MREWSRADVGVLRELQVALGDVLEARGAGGTVYATAGLTVDGERPPAVAEIDPRDGSSRPGRSWSSAQVPRQAFARSLPWRSHHSRRDPWEARIAMHRTAWARQAAVLAHDTNG